MGDIFRICVARGLAVLSAPKIGLTYFKSGSVGLSLSSRSQIQSIHTLGFKHSSSSIHFIANTSATKARSFSSSETKMTKTALVVVANGSEELEAVTAINILRRAGVEVTVAGLTGPDAVKCSRGVVVVPDKGFKEVTASTTYDAVLLPGGMEGSQAFVDSEALGVVLKEQEKAGRLIAAMCAAPTALKKHGIGLGKSLTSYPGAFKERMMEGNVYKYLDERVVVDGQLITSQGPATAMDWALAVAENLTGKEKAEEVANGLLVKKH